MAKTKDQLSQMFAAAAQPQTFAAAVQVVSDQFAQALGGAPQLEAALREQAQRVSDLADLVHTIYAADAEPDEDAKDEGEDKDMKDMPECDKPKAEGAATTEAAKP